MPSDINELISKEALDAFNKFQTDLGKVVTMLDTVVKLGSSFDKSVASINKGVASQNELNKKITEATDIQKKYQLATDQEVKAKLQFQKATKDQKESIQAIIDAEEKEVGTLTALVNANKRLRKERSDLDLTTKQGIQRLKEINSEVDKNTKFITKNVDGLSKQKIGIGAYAEGIKSAALHLVSFATVAALAAAAVDKIKTAFLSTDAGVELTKKWEGITKSFWYQISHLRTKGSADMKIAMADEGALAQMHVEERTEMVKVAKLETDIKLLRLQAINEPLKAEALLTEAEKKEDEIVKMKTDHLSKEIVLMEALWMQTKDAALADEIAAKKVELINIQGEHSLRIATKLAALKTKEAKEEDIRLTEEQIEKSRAYAIALTEQLAAMERAGIAPVSGPSDSSNAIVKDSHISGKQQTKVEDIGNIMDKAYARLDEMRQKEDDKELKLKENKARLEKEIIQGVFSFEEQLLERKIQKLEVQKNAELSAKNLTESQKQAINEKYAKKEAALKRKQAISDKAAAMFSIAIDTAKGVAAALKTPPLIPFIIALGAIEEAVVMAKPIPQFAKGTKSAPGGLSIVGEKGKELIMSPSGSLSLTGDGPELVNLERNSKVFTSEETKRIVAAAAMTKENYSIEQTIRQGNAEIVKAIKNKREIILGTGTGRSITERSGNTYKTYFERHLI
jgi:hypothetical protein